MNSQFVTTSLHLPASSIVPPLDFTAVVTDSRKIQSGCLFVALKGEKFDAHEFIPQALTQGARGVICRKGAIPASERPNGVHFYEVEDTQEAYRRLGAAWRKQFQIPVVMVAGSAGKTTTKEILTAILRGKWNSVLKTQGSQNGFVGIPMTLLELKPEHGAAVIEVGIDEIGAMIQHTELVQATAGLLTAIGPEHLENLRDVPTVALEEGIALSEIARAGGRVAVNLDDPWIAPHFEKIQNTDKLAYTLDARNPLRARPEVLCGELSSDGAALAASGLGLNGERFALPLLGRHNALNLLAALTMARGLGLSIDEIRRGLETFQGAEGRSQIRKFPRGVQVICDYYNSQPASAKAGLELLTQISPSGSQRIACLGDMLELGSEEEMYHRELAPTLIGLGIQEVLLYGPRMKWLLDELKKRAFAGQATHFASHAELVSSLISRGVPADSAILIKGSRSMKMEEVWKPLEQALSQA